MNKLVEKDINDFVRSGCSCDFLRNKCVLITGATGLVGSVLTKCLLALDASLGLSLRIVCQVRNIAKAQMVFEEQFDKIKWIVVDIDAISVSDVESDIDYIIHLANPTASKYFITHPVETFNSIVDGTKNVLEIAKKRSVIKMVYVSSIEVYGSILSECEQITEAEQGYINPLDSRSCYSLGKRAAECLCHMYSNEYGVDVSVARLTQTFGAGISKDDNRVFAQFARSAINGNDIVLHTKGDSAKPYCYTTDVVSAILTILEGGCAGEAYNVSNDQSYISIKNMAEMVKEYFNPEIQVVVDIQENMGYAPTTKLRLSSRKLQDLGWHPTKGLIEMFALLIDYLKHSEHEDN